jgi:phosphatidylglycerol lysyltransferase
MHGHDPHAEPVPTDAGKKHGRVAAIGSLIQKLLPVFAVGMFGIAIYFVHHLLKAHSYHEIRDYVRSIPLSHTVSAIALTYFSYFVLSGYDFLGFKYIGRKIATSRIIFASMTAFAFSNNIGLANLAGGSIRLRIYSTYGIDPKDTLKVIAFVSVTFWCGFCALAGVLLTLYPLPFPPSFGISVGFVRAFGVLLLFIAIGYVVACGLIRRKLTIRGHELQLPILSIAIRQLIVAAADWALAGFVLFLLLPESAGVTYPQFLTIFISAQVVALIAHVPGGVGVLEALVIYFVTPDHSSNPGVLGALIAYRAIYYLLPLATSAAALVGYEIYRKRHVVATLGQNALSWTSLIIPPVVSVIAFLSGSILLLSNATPGMQVRLQGLNDILPLPLIETSHFLAGCVGALLLILSRGLLSRSRAAWVVTLGLVFFSAFLSLAKGLEYEDAAALGVFALILLGAKDQFHRDSPLFKEPWGVGWAMAVTMVIGCSLWLGYFTHKHLEYASELWWTFALRGDAPRFLRATIGILITFTGVAAYHLLVPNRRRQLPAPLERTELEALVTASNDPSAAGLLKDGSLLFASRLRNSVLRYRVHEKIWIALGDPLGRPDSFEDLVYDFVAVASDQGAVAVFDSVHSDHLSLFSDLKMSFIPIGEDIIVDFDRAAASPLSSSSGVDGAAELDLQFSEAQLPVATLLSQGRPLASASLLTPAGSKAELAIDQVELSPGASPAAIGQLLVSLGNWARGKGFRSLNLGTFAVGQLDTEVRESTWSRSTQLLYEARERAYNFKSLSAFFETFAPRSKPRYLAYPSHAPLDAIFSALVSVSKESVITNAQTT